LVFLGIKKHLWRLNLYVAVLGENREDAPCLDGMQDLQLSVCSSLALFTLRHYLPGLCMELNVCLLMYSSILFQMILEGLD
jgi:hypothetical protein